MIIKHHLTVYVENNEKKYAESWLQIDIFGKSYCFSRRKKELAQGVDWQFTVEDQDNNLVARVFGNDKEGYKGIANDDYQVTIETV